MDKFPREKLRELVETYGSAFYGEPKRCRNFLKDICGEYTKEINLLLKALESGVVQELTEGSSLLEARLARFVRKLMDEHGLAEENSRWAVGAWAFTFGIELPEAQPEQAGMEEKAPKAAPSMSDQPTPKLSPPPAPVPIQPQMSRAPVAEVSQKSFTDLNDLKPRQMYSRSFILNNIGGGNLTGDITSNRGWLKIMNKIDPLSHRQEIHFQVDTTGLPYGLSDTGCITLRTNGGNINIDVRIKMESPEALMARFKKTTGKLFAMVGALIGAVLYVVYHGFWGYRVLPLATWTGLALLVPISFFVRRKVSAGIASLLLALPIVAVWSLAGIDLAMLFPLFWAIIVAKVLLIFKKRLFVAFARGAFRSAIFGAILAVCLAMVAPFYAYHVYQRFNSLRMVGNTSGNLYNNGLAATDGIWIYYANSTRESRRGLRWDLCRMKKDGSKKEILCKDIGPVQINVLDGWVYFRSWSRKGIFKVRTNGADLVKISPDFLTCLVAKGWNLYYSDDLGGYGIYKVLGDILPKVKIVEHTAGFFYYHQGYFYCIDQYDEKVYKIDHLGNQLTILEHHITGMNFAGQWIYYLRIPSSSHNGGPIYRMDTYGENIQIIYSKKVYGLNISDDWIYFYNSSGIHKMRLDGSSLETISTDFPCYLNIADDWIIYAMGDGLVYKMYAIRTDGTRKMNL